MIDACKWPWKTATRSSSDSGTYAVDGGTRSISKRISCAGLKTWKGLQRTRGVEKRTLGLKTGSLSFLLPRRAG
jgi:hypothetical protein